MLKIQLPISALSVNKAWQGRRFKTPEYKKYEQDCLCMLSAHKDRKIGGMIGIVLDFYFKNHKMRDFDNAVKPICDILVKSGIIDDDRNIYWAVIRKYPAKNDSMEISIYRYDSNEVVVGKE